LQNIYFNANNNLNNQNNRDSFAHFLGGGARNSLLSTLESHHHLQQ
jgi:hypothetical protein